MKRQASVHDISWFIDLNSMKRLNLDPPYQRRSVWTSNDRRFFLDTIFRNYPCPPIFIHKTINDSGVITYHIVDGKQRLETILRFHANKISIAKDFGDERLNGKKFRELDAESKKIFWNYNVPVDFIDIPNGLDVNEVFDRVNRNSRNLERQELRHARYDGWFINEAEAEADDDLFWEEIKISTKAKAKRMKNVQFVSELLLIIIDHKIVGFDQDYLDARYAQLDNLEDNEAFDKEAYLEEKNRVKKYLAEMEAHNHCITEYARVAYNFYTLFALVALNKPLIAAIKLAEKYAAFMSIVETLKDIEDLEEYVSIPMINKPAGWEEAYRYFSFSKGANTDLVQRQERLTVLITSLL